MLEESMNFVWLFLWSSFPIWTRLTLNVMNVAIDKLFKKKKRPVPSDRVFLIEKHDDEWDLLRGGDNDFDWI
jgi:hypothetical protein